MSKCYYNNKLSENCFNQSKIIDIIELHIFKLGYQGHNYNIFYIISHLSLDHEIVIR